MAPELEILISEQSPDDIVTSEDGDGGSGSSPLSTETTILTSYPNPFNNETVIQYELTETARIFLDIFNLRGQRIARLADGVLQAGRYSVKWQGKNTFGGPVSSGIYFVRLISNQNVYVSKIMLKK